jgi:hypothetical protein
MNGPEIYALANSGANISITLPIQDLMQLVTESDRLATERARAAYERMKEDGTPEEAMTAKEFCQFWKISQKTLANWVNRKVVAITKIGGEIRIDPEEQRRLRATRKVMNNL